MTKAELAALGEDPDAWTHAWHTEDLLDLRAATRAAYKALPFGHMIAICEVRGAEAGIDGTLILVRTIYSHS